MHKKPIYSFEDKADEGIEQMPIFSLMHIENTAGIGAFAGLSGKPALVLVLRKDNTTNVGTFIGQRNQWIWLYNGDLDDKFDLYVKKAGDDMTGDLHMLGSNTDITLQGGDITTGNGDIKVGSGIVTSSHKANNNTEMVTAQSYAKSNMGGTIKARRSGNTLYMTTNGNNA